MKYLEVVHGFRKQKGTVPGSQFSHCKVSNLRDTLFKGLASHVVDLIKSIKSIVFTVSEKDSFSFCVET